LSAQGTESQHRTVVVASSAGGLVALLGVLPLLPATFPAPVICVQHVSPRQPSYLADILGRRTMLKVAVVTPGARPQTGLVLLAPPDRHAIVETDGSMGLWDGPPVNHVRPSADLLFSSAAAVLGDRTVALVLSGTGHDGAAGSAAVKARGGLVVVQSPGTCDFPGMVEATMRLVEPDAVVPLGELAATLERLVAEVPA
jgi:two-component system, chemotaxis family, protein-glutamate methylesterase/glutaminase